MYESAMITGIQPAAKASISTGCPSRAPRITKQNVAFYVPNHDQNIFTC